MEQEAVTGRGEPNYSLPEISAEHQGLLVPHKINVSACQIYMQKNMDETSHIHKIYLATAWFQKHSSNVLTTIVTLLPAAQGQAPRYNFPGCCCSILVSDSAHQPHRFFDNQLKPQARPLFSTSNCMT